MQERSRPDYRFAAPIRNLVHRFAYVGLLIVAFGLMMLGKADTVLMERMRAHVTDALAPIMNVISRPVTTMSNIIDHGRELIEIHAQNAELRETNRRLLQWQTAARRLEIENSLLQSLLNFKPEPNAAFLSARVIADTGGAFAHSLVLNAGWRDGVRKGQAVVTGEGLTGRIDGVGSISSRVILITDLNSRIPILVETSNTRAILAGDNAEQPKLIHLAPSSTVKVGNRVVTSGHGGAFPPGLPVGVVSAVSDEATTVQLFIKRERLEFVRVVDFGLEGILRPDTSTANLTGNKNKDDGEPNAMGGGGKP